MIYEPVMNVSLDGNNSTLKTSSFVVICVKTMEINILYNIHIWETLQGYKKVAWINVLIENFRQFYRTIYYILLFSSIKYLFDYIPFIPYQHKFGKGHQSLQNIEYSTIVAGVYLIN